VLYARSVRRNIVFGLETDEELDAIEVQRLRAKAMGADNTGWWGKLQVRVSFRPPHSSWVSPHRVSHCVAQRWKSCES
jgi:hypothetical protein